MHKSFIIFLSLILIANTGMAIIIQEIDDPDTPTITEGKTLDVALIEDYIDQKAKEIANEIDFQTEAKLTDLNNKIDEIINQIFQRIALAILCLCLFNFNMFLASKLLTGIVFKDA